MSGPPRPESVKGMIPANARLGIGFEQLHLIITDRRIVVVHRAKKGAGGLASILIFGSHSGAFEDPDKPAVGPQWKERFLNVDVDKVLASNKNNFDISYQELISVEIEGSRDSTRISMVTSNDKFQFFTGSAAKELVKLLAEHLGDKLVARKTRA